jgi:hypothetical protein
LDWLDEPARQAFLASVANQSPDCLVLTGDIADGQETAGYLHRIQRALDRPVYFVGRRAPGRF